MITNLYVIANFFTNNKTISEQIYSLKRYQYIFVDECYLVIKEDIIKLYNVKVKFGAKLLCGGAFDQMAAIDTNNDNYNLKDNHLLNDLLLDGVEVKLNYMEGWGRFEDKLYEDIISIVDTGMLPEHFCNQQASDEHWFHLTITRKKRDEMAKQCSIRYINRLENWCNKGIVYDGWGYCNGMELVSYSNTKIN